MKIRLLDRDVLRKEELYEAFKQNTLKERDDFFTDEIIELDEAPIFPIYLHVKNDCEKRKKYKEAFFTIAKYYINTDRDIHFNDLFWYSLLCVYNRDYLIKEYPEVEESIEKFNNIVLKKFDWENYIYKCVLATQYITDNIKEKEQQEKFFDLIIDNLDVYNYIIKYEVFRNDLFLIHVLQIIDNNNLSSILKMKIRGRDDLGKDERYGRRVLLELNKMYPSLVYQVMEYDELEKLFLEQLKKYYV